MEPLPGGLSPCMSWEHSRNLGCIPYSPNFSKDSNKAGTEGCRLQTLPVQLPVTRFESPCPCA